MSITETWRFGSDPGYQEWEENKTKIENENLARLARENKKMNYLSQNMKN